MPHDVLVESLSGVRGVYGQSLTLETAADYAQVFGFCLKQKSSSAKAVVGADTRPSSAVIKEIFIKEFNKLGLNVIDAGVATTPMIELGVRAYGAQGGVIITASHNEPEYNGWKLLQADGSILPEKDMLRLVKQTRHWKKRKFDHKSGRVVVKEDDLKKKYITEVRRLISKKAERQIRRGFFKVVVDVNGGAAAAIARPLLKKMNIKVIGVGLRAGEFLRKVEPNSATLIGLVKIIDARGADLGVGFDCDADRAEFVLPTSAFTKKRGNMICGHYALALAVDSILGEKKTQAPVVVNLATLHLVHEIAKKYGVSVTEVDVGETNVVEKMKAAKSLIGGEGSNGGIIIGGTTCRDGLLSLLFILALMAKKNQSLAEILAAYPVYYEARLGVKSAGSDNHLIIKGLTRYFKKNLSQYELIPGAAGGLKILYDQNTWLFFRASQTEAGLFRIIAGGPDKKRIDSILRDGEKVFKKVSKT